jgi:transposase
MRPAEPLDADEAAVSPRMAFLLADMRARRAEPDRRIAALDAALAAMAKADPRARRLAAVPGIGALDATALVAPGGGCR